MKKSGMFGRAWSGLKQYPVIYHAVLILLLFTAVAIVSYISLAFGTRHGMKRRVPDFIGLRLNDAQYYASRRGLNIIVNDSLYVPAYPGGIVLDQLPKGGVDVKSGRKIYVTINSFRQKQVPLPYVAGRSLRQAKNMLEGAGLGIRELIYVEDIATNYVLAEYYEDTEITAESDMKVEKGSNVTLHVGVASADERSVVPYLIGRRMFEAKGRLWEIGLNVGEVFYDEDITMLTLDDALKIALSESPTVQIADQTIEAKKYAKKGTYASLWPEISASATYQRYIKKQRLHFNGMDVEVGTNNN